MRIVVFGTGLYYLKRKTELPGETKIIAFLDNDRELIEDIPKVDYDYRVIAILNADIVREIKKTLMCSGVCEEKIAVMDASVITEDAIPDAIKN